MKAFKALCKAVVIIAFTLAVLFGLFFVVDYVQTEIIAGGDYILTIIGKSVYLIVIPVIVIVLLIIGAFAKLFRLKLKRNSGGYKIIRSINRHPAVYSAVSLLCLFLITVNFCVIREDEIVKYGIFSPTGRAYKLSEAEKITAGFNWKGEFVYNVKINGRSFKLTAEAGTVSDKYSEGFSEIAYIDALITQLAPDSERDISDKNMDKYGYDEASMKNIREVIER